MVGCGDDGVVNALDGVEGTGGVVVAGAETGAGNQGGMSQSVRDQAKIYNESGRVGQTVCS